MCTVSQIPWVKPAACQGFRWEGAPNYTKIMEAKSPRSTQLSGKSHFLWTVHTGPRGAWTGAPKSLVTPFRVMFRQVGWHGICQSSNKTGRGELGRLKGLSDTANLLEPRKSGQPATKCRICSLNAEPSLSIWAWSHQATFSSCPNITTHVGLTLPPPFGQDISGLISNRILSTWEFCSERAKHRSPKREAPSPSPARTWLLV